MEVRISKKLTDEEKRILGEMGRIPGAKEVLVSLAADNSVNYPSSNITESLALESVRKQVLLDLSVLIETLKHQGG